MNWSLLDALADALAAPFKALSGAAGSSGPIGEIAAKSASFGGMVLKYPAVLGLRAAQGIGYVLAIPVAAIGALFAAHKIGEHMSGETPKARFNHDSNAYALHETQSLIDQNPLDEGSARAINGQVANMLAAQNHIAASSSQHQGTQALREQQLQA